MATFGELRTRLRNDVIAESSTDFFSDADLLDFLIEASVEIASAGGFPVQETTISVASGSNSAAAPSGISNVEFREVTFKGFQLTPVDSRTVRLYREVGGAPRYYHFDPRAGGNIEFAPAATSSGSLVVEYIQNLEGESYTTASVPWDGRLTDWQDAIVYLAGVKAFERSQEYDASQYWVQRLERRLRSLSVYLQNENVLNLVARSTE